MPVKKRLNSDPNGIIRKPKVDDLSKKENATFYAVGDAHLDTQWNWTVRDTIYENIPRTLKQNFALFEKYPAYKFSFEGAFRYKLVKEYYAVEYEKLKEYIASGQWNVTGSSWDAGDANVPSSEALMRNILYGNGYFEREFGKTSTDIFLPDCFGFGYALPSVAVHMGLNGFSTQKLSWGNGTPKYNSDGSLSQTEFSKDDRESMDFGKWKGPDGNAVMVVLQPGTYGNGFQETGEEPLDMRNGTDRSNASILGYIQRNAKHAGLYASFRYHGQGDRGGSPPDASAKMLQQAIDNPNPDAQYKVIAAAADQIYNDITEEQFEKLPEYEGEFLYRHGVGGYTSQSPSKRWNRQNELLADSAERASVIADWLGGKDYPADNIRRAWELFTWHQFHDDLPGTSILEAYEISQNDYIIALNTLATELEDSTNVVAKALKTSDVQGVPVIVYNPVSAARKDLVKAQINIASDYVKVYDMNGNEVASQLSVEDGKRVVKFVANVAPVSYTVFEVRASDSPCTVATELKVENQKLENERYTVKINDGGDISSVFDKENNREMLAEPVRFEILPDNSNAYPSWELEWSDFVAPTRFVEGTPVFETADNGPAVVSVKVTRVMNGSVYIQTISLYSGSDRVDIDNHVEWFETASLLKARVAMAVSNEKATFDLGLGTIARGQSNSFQFEYVAQQWADITQADNSYGVSVMNDCKYGWDKPNDNTLRLTLIHTPTAGRFCHERWQDLGENNFKFSLTGHKGLWEDTPVKAANFNQPLIPFATSKHDGAMGRELSFMSVNSGSMLIKAVKQEEKEQHRTIVRVQSMSSNAIDDAKISFITNIESAVETNGYETPIGDASYSGNTLSFEMTPYEVKTFAVTLKNPEASLTDIHSTQKQLELPYNKRVTTSNNDRGAVAYVKDHSIPEELFEDTLQSGNITFKMGKKGEKNAVVCGGQTIAVPEGAKKMYFLAASTNGDKTAAFKIDGKTVNIKIQDMEENIGVWDCFSFGYAAKIKPDRIGTYYTHTHDETGDMAYKFSYLFRYEADVSGASGVTLPNDAEILVLAATTSNDASETSVLTNLYDKTKEAGKLYKLSVQKPYSIFGKGAYPEGKYVYIKLKGMPSYANVSDWGSKNIVWSDGLTAVIKMPDADVELKPVQDMEYEFLMTDASVTANNYTGRADETPEKAIDTDEGTKWCSNDADEDGAFWLEADLGTPCQIAQWYVSNVGIRENKRWNTYNYELQYKLNKDDTWQVADAVRENTKGSTMRKLSKQISARYVRLYITDPVMPGLGEKRIARIYEFHVLGKKD